MKNNIEDLLVHMKKRPQMFVGKMSLELIAAYIDTVFIGTLKGGKIKTFYKWDGRNTDMVIDLLKSLGLLQ